MRQSDTEVQFDARRLLGILPGGALPHNFNDPVEFNLFQAVDPIARRVAEDRAAKRARDRAAARAAPAGQPPRRRRRL